MAGEASIGWITVLKVAKFNLTSAAYSVTDWTNVAGDPGVSIRSATDSLSGFGLRSLTTTNWNASFGNNAWDGYGETVDDGGGFAFPQQVTYRYWYNYNDAFTSGKYQLQLFNLNASKTYTLIMLGSRSNANGATSPRITDYNIRGIQVETVQSLSNFQNTSHTVTFENIQPNVSGEIDIAINRKANGTGGSFGYLNGVIVIETS